jgi:hypothetical protein
MSDLLPRLSTTRSVSIIRDYAQRPRIVTWLASRTPTDGVTSTAISELTNSQEYDALKQLLNVLQGEVAALADDGKVTFKEIVFVGSRLVRHTFTYVNRLTNLTFEQRKALVLHIADEFYTKVVAPLDIPGVPALIENSIVDPKLGGYWHDAVSGLFDFVDSMFVGNEPLAALGNTPSGGLPDGAVV